MTTLTLAKLDEIEAAADQYARATAYCNTHSDVWMPINVMAQWHLACDPATVAALVRIARAAVEYYDGTNTAYGEKWRALGDALCAAGLIE